MAIVAQRKLVDAVKDLISLCYDAAQACEASSRLSDAPGVREKFTAFRKMHLRHARELTMEVQLRGGTPPSANNFTPMLTEGRRYIEKVAASDTRLLEAMESNEQTCAERYELVLGRDDLPKAVRKLLHHQHDDVERMSGWLSDQLRR